MTVATINVKQLRDLQKSGKSPTILDVRTRGEFESVHAETALNVPLDELDPAKYAGAHDFDADAPLYVICKMGGRSHQACEKFIAAGYRDVVNVEGGTEAWQRAGNPVAVGERKVLPLDCQVRIAAGSLVVIGALLSLMNSAFAVIPIFIGAGLVYSGATNTCGIASVFARMPWNQSGKSNVTLPVVDAPKEPVAACDDGG